MYSTNLKAAQNLFLNYFGADAASLRVEASNGAYRATFNNGHGITTIVISETHLIEEAQPIMIQELANQHNDAGDILAECGVYTMELADDTMQCLEGAFIDGEFVELENIPHHEGRGSVEYKIDGDINAFLDVLKVSKSSMYNQRTVVNKLIALWQNGRYEAISDLVKRHVTMVQQSILSA